MFEYEYKVILKTNPRQDQRVYNKPNISQVATPWVEGEENGEHGRRNIQVRTHSDLSITNGDDLLNMEGIGKEIPFNFFLQHIYLKLIICLFVCLFFAVMGKSLENTKCVAIKEFYNIMPTNFGHVCMLNHVCCFLVDYFKYIVDSYVKLETQRLVFFFNIKINKS